MPPRVKNPTAERYWREVEGLSRLAIAFEKDDVLSEEERQEALAAANALKDKLVNLAKARAA